jgi:hypothetical protein
MTANIPLLSLYVFTGCTGSTSGTHNLEGSFTPLASHLRPSLSLSLTITFAKIKGI